MDMHNLRPPDADAIKTALRTAKTLSGVPVAFAGQSDHDQVVLRHFIGVRTDGLRELRVRHGCGLGGHVAVTSKPASVADYSKSEGITAHYRDAVGQEGLRGMVAVPVMVEGLPRVVLYGSLRIAGAIGDHVTRSFRTAATTLGSELHVRDEVDRRLSEVQFARAERQFGMETTDRERLRTLQGELRAIAAELTDTELRDRMLAAGNLIAELGNGPDSKNAPEGVALSPRELDVLTQVALGCTNGEVASRLSLSPETIKAYMRNIGIKLDTSSRAESVARARLLGLML